MSNFIKNLIPKYLDQLDFNKNLIKPLKILIKDSSMNNLLIHGKNKSGKNTILHATLREVDNFNKMKLFSENLKINNNTIKVSYLNSNNNFIIEPSKYNLYDKYIITHLIKTISKTKNINDKTKIIIIKNAHNLSIDAQQSLRRTMEIFSSNVKFILISRKSNKIITPIRSRCLKIRCSIPNEDDLKLKLNKLNTIYELNLNNKDKEYILKECNLNFETLYLIIDMMYNLKIPLYKIEFPEDKIKILVKQILESKNINDIKLINSTLNKIIIDNIELQDLVNTIILNLRKTNLSDEIKIKCVEVACDSDQQILVSSKEIFHLELFLIKIYKIIHNL